MGPGFEPGSLALMPACNGMLVSVPDLQHLPISVVQLLPPRPISSYQRVINKFIKLLKMQQSFLMSWRKPAN